MLISVNNTVSYKQNERSVFRGTAIIDIDLSIFIPCVGPCPHPSFAPSISPPRLAHANATVARLAFSKLDYAALNDIARARF